MKIIIPAAGKSQRFKDSGYLESKPLIRINGSTILEHQLTEFAEDQVQVVMNKSDERKIDTQRLIEKFPNARFIFCHETNSVIETLSYADTRGEITVVDCDIIVSRADIAKAKGNYVLFFEDVKLIPRYSYIETTPEGAVKRITEKVKTSNKACCGVYGYRNGFQTETYLQTEEAYQSHHIMQLIERGEKFQAIRATTYTNLGTPEQLKRNGRLVKPIKKTYCVDLDQTLVTKSKSGNHEDCLPISENIRITNKLYDDGNTIIIHTARRMKTHNGDVEKVIKDIGELTRKQLEKFGIKYHKIEFGKPYADYYIDDKAMLSGKELGRELGIYFGGHNARSFNKITEKGDWIIKEGKTVNNEIYWYKNVDENWRRANTPEFDTLGSMLSLKKVNGKTASELYTDGDDLKLSCYINKIRQLHNTSGKPDVNVAEIEDWYRSKLVSRFKEKDYPAGAAEIYSKLLDWCSKYKVKEIRQIHGDPVFTNAIKTKDGYRFIDPRGKIGEKNTVFGDPMYDMAKIYQSISGYDFILAKARIYESYVEKTQNEFLSITGIRKKEIEVMVGYLYFTLIPLHTENKERFFEMAVKMLKES